MKVWCDLFGSFGDLAVVTRKREGIASFYGVLSPVGVLLAGQDGAFIREP